jgi:AcrR family transcriptional regulator
MSRWEPNARGRLEQAALDLYLERGFEQTTVADIAERAELTERTFFRHFADKREVLFSGSGSLRDAMVHAVAAASDGTTPLDAIAAALEAAAGVLQGRRAQARRRQRVIDANPALQERELMKLATLSAALADALRRRGVPAREAALAGETGIAVFKVAFERWISTRRAALLAEVIRETFAELRGLTATG